MDCRIVDPEVAEGLAHREQHERNRADYWWGYSMGKAALGDAREMRRMRVTAKFIAELDSMNAQCGVGT